MALDEALMLCQRLEDTPPTLRFYAWDPPAVSIGYFQSMGREINLAACAARGISTVRRFTGGRAILHDREVTYSLAARADNPLVAGPVLDAYLRISRCLLAGMRHLGIAAGLSQLDVKRQPTTACFDTPSRHELVVKGRKLAGSAQARRQGCVLQHGSIPLALDPDKLLAVINFADDRERSCYKDKFLAGTISLNEAGQKEYSYPEVVKALILGFTGVVDLAAGEITPLERETAAQLLQKKYRSQAWTFKI
jgi:lipoate-protein ligase A